MSTDRPKKSRQPPIKRIVLLDEGVGRDTRFLEAVTENNGVLALNGQDLGPKVREFFHTDEYEYFYRVPAPYKNTLLLYLLKEKFEAGFVFNDWLDEHRIPYEFFNWYSPDEG